MRAELRAFQWNASLLIHFRYIHRHPGTGLISAVFDCLSGNSGCLFRFWNTCQPCTAAASASPTTTSGISDDFSTLFLRGHLARAA